MSERVEPTRYLQFESILGLDSGTGGVDVAPDTPVLMENREEKGMDILVAIKNL